MFRAGFRSISPAEDSKTSMTDRIEKFGLQIARPLYDLIELEALPATGVASDQFWRGLSELVWSATAPGYSVESASNLAPPVVWRLLTNPIIEINGSFRMTIDPAQSDQYFRLRAP